jgi:Periplasmic protease
MTSSVRLFFNLLLLLGLGLQIAIGQNETDTLENANAEGLPLDELRTFTEVFSKIKNDYVEPVDDRKLLEDAIRGMLAGLDPHSAYLDKDSYKELQEGTTGEFGGLGIEVGLEDGFVKVIAPNLTILLHNAPVSKKVISLFVWMKPRLKACPWMTPSSSCAASRERILH